MCYYTSPSNQSTNSTNRLHSFSLNFQIIKTIIMFKNKKNQRIGSRLEDGKAAHSADHQQWSRRQFMSSTSMMAAGGMLFGSSPLLSWASPLISSLYSNPDNDRVLILVRLGGGNDGLNTIVPYGLNFSTNDDRRDRYESLRSDTLISKTDLNQLMLADETNSVFGLPTYMGVDNGDTGIYKMWQDGNMAVIHNVGYPNQNRSHFTGSDLWASGAVNNSNQQDQRQYSGWMGRYFDQTLPAFLSTPPTIPPVIQIGSSSNLIFRGLKGNPFDLVFSDLEAFDAVIQNGSLYGNDAFDGDCVADIERVFVRNVADNTLRYAEAVQRAYNQSETPENTYDSNNPLEAQLEIVARLIKGRLGTKIYMVSLGSFDTHSGQKDTHESLLETLSNAVRTTFDDLEDSGHQDRVMMMTFSEFGRTVKENGSQGTDHGTLAPVMLFGGSGLQGRQMYGTGINLEEGKIDQWNSVHFESQEGAIDFRAVYDKVLRDWLCADAQTSEDTLNYDVDNNDDLEAYKRCSDGIPGTDTPFGECVGDPLAGMILGGCNATVSESSTVDSYISSLVTMGYNVVGNNIEIKYATKMTANVELKILNSNGDVVQYSMGTGDSRELVLVQKVQEAGSYLYTLENQYTDNNNTTQVKLNPNIKYTCQLEVNGMLVKRQLVIH